ncbi:MAG: hypothetical protein JJT82_08695 [Legionellaceae bacterium]|nr:hypothetical protein [Legionellaceae bacterium]
MNAIIMNTISNGILSLFLVYCVLRSAFLYLRGDPKYTLFIVLTFLTLLGITLLGAWVHYVHAAPYAQYLWQAIALAVVFLNYSVTYAIDMSDKVRVFAMLLSLVSMGIFNYSSHFIVIALLLIFIYSLAAYYSTRRARLGFIAIVLANIAWIMMRKGANAMLGYEVPLEWRYDNDIYHLLLIVAFYILYRSIEQGDWSYPNRQYR